MTKTGAMRSDFLAACCVSIVLGFVLTIGWAAASGLAAAKSPAKSEAVKTSTAPAGAQQSAPSAEEAKASPSAPRRAATLAEHRKLWAAYVAAKAKHRAACNVYWKKIAVKRAIRKRKLAKSQTIVRSDYVLEQPPRYTGPEAPEAFFKPEKKDKPNKKPAHKKTLPVLADFLKHAKAQYGFTPRRIPELEFKRCYAREALALGLTKEQVVRVYAFETGGYGAYDMQAGFDQATGKVYPVSTALGYAQLLNANSVSEVANHGDEFADRLEQMAKAPGVDAALSRELKAKAAAVRAMFKWASSQSGEWKEQVRLAGTPKGVGVHALNIDAEVGPWIQVSKLREIKEFAAHRGMRNLTAAQLELMNLAGPGRGFEMMQPHLKNLPTANFFERAGYERNPVTNYRTGAELLAKIEALMEKNMKKNGAQEFVLAFEQL